MDTASIKTKFDKLCQCGICLDLLKLPKTLNCQHSFCQKCLMLTCTENRMGLMSLFCPSCRQRQPLVFRPVDVLKLPTPFFVNQVIEILQEWSNRLKKNDPVYTEDETSSIKTTEPDFVNTKITSVFKSINAETLEQMTQIRTDEFGVQSVKMKELKEEIQRSRKVNSELLIDNFIMKTRLDKQNDNKQCVLEPTYSVNEKLRKYINKRGDFSSHSTYGQQIKDECPDQVSTLIQNTMYDSPLYKNKGKGDTEKLKHGKIVKYTDSKRSSSNDTPSIQCDNNNKSTAGQTKSSSNIFCWRCMRRGHIGNSCKEKTTLLGRKICSSCNLVGHESDSCHYY